MNPFPRELDFGNAGIFNGRRCIVFRKRFPAITSLGMVEIHAGFVSDGGSIPDAAVPIVGNGFNSELECYAVHDLLYSEHNTDFSRAEADYILKELLWNTNVPKWKILLIYSAVRVFGGKHFKAKIPPI